MGVLEGLAWFLTMHSSTISRECPFSQWSADKCDFPDFHVLYPYFYEAYVWYKVPCAFAIWLYSFMGVLEGLARFPTMQSSTISPKCPFSQWSADECDFPDFHVLQPYFYGAYAWYKVSCACVIWLYSSIGVIEGLARFLTMQCSTSLENARFHSDPRIIVISLISTSCTNTFLGDMLDTKYHVRVLYNSTVLYTS